MNRSSSEPVHVAIEELRANPSRFQKTGGYERLVALLEDGHSPTALKEILQVENCSFAGDLLWAVCELEDVSPFVAEAVRHLNSRDKGTAGYAAEVILRGAHDAQTLGDTLKFLIGAPTAVREHAVFVLASLGVERGKEIFDLAGWTWAVSLIDELQNGDLTLDSAIKSMVDDHRVDRQFLGLIIATVASEQNESVVELLERSQTDWALNIAGQLRRMFGHRW